MKHTNYYIPLLLFLLIFSMSCNKEVDNKKQITLSFWQTMNEEETETLKTVIGDFESLHPNINIDMHYVPFSDARSKFMISNSSGNSADIFRSEISWISNFADKKFLLNLTDYISSQDRADYLEAALNSSIYNGELWSLPQVTDVLALFYNKRLLKQAGYDRPPETLDELESYTIKIKDQLNIEGFYLRSRYGLIKNKWTF
jgi:arabinogalactan oligomer/maltooligosaccharide transport system substrate-binding protein